MNKPELLEKIKEKNEELNFLNKDLKEIIAEENAKNLGKCFRVGSFYYCKVIQILPKNHDKYKILTVFGEEISIDYWASLKDSEANPCSVEEFDGVYDEVINNALANKVIK